MRPLAELLEEHSETISKNWLARLNRSGAAPYSPELRDALPEILRELNVALRRAQSKTGELTPGVYPPHRLGFDLEIVFAEYALLSDCVLEVLTEQGALHIDEVRALNDVFSRAVARAVNQHVEQARDRDRNRTETARVQTQTAHESALAQEQAARNEAQLEREAQHRLFMQAPVAIAILEGPEHRFTFANPAYRALVNDRDVVGKPLVEALPELAGEGFDHLLDEVIAGGKALFRKEAEIRLDRQSADECLFANFTYTPKRDSEGRIDGVLVSASEVTEQVRARRNAVRLNAQLGESELLLRNLVDNLPDIAWSAAADGSIDFYNRRWFEYTGTTLEEMQGWNWQQMHDPASLPKVIESWHHSLATGEPLEMEFPLRAADGTFQWFLTRVRPLRDRSGKIVRWIGTNTNIHQQREATRRAEEASRTKDEFLATASHELRTPLNAILGWARILRSGQVDPSAYARGLETIERNAKAQVRLIEDILDGSRIITGKLHLEIRPLDLTALVRAALDAVRPAADAKGIVLRVELDPAAARVVGDPERLQQVVWNLANNAVKFTPKGGLVTVSLRRAGTTIELTVSDNGQGIAADFLPFVFDRFCQAEGSTTRRYGGLGLGLALVRNLVEAHGGTVQAESAGEGRGASFIVQLPVQAVYEEPVAPAERPSQPRSSADAPMGRVGLAGVKVLLVDDELDARELVATVLRASGAQVTTAASAAQAMEHLVSDMPTVLVSDIGMPEVDGYELIRALRRKPGKREGWLRGAWHAPRSARSV